MTMIEIRMGIPGEVKSKCHPEVDHHLVKKRELLESIFIINNMVVYLQDLMRLT